MSRDRTLGDTVYFLFTTKTAALVPTTLLGTPVVSVYEDDSESQITSGVSIAVDHDSVAGLSLVTVVATTGNGYESDKEYAVVVTTGTVDGVSYVGTVVGHFSLGKIADSVWDEPLTGNSHNLATSAGKRLRQVEEAFVHAGGVVAAVTNGHTLTLDTGAVGTADYYIGDRLQIVEGTGAGQSRLIKGYTSGRVVTLDSDFTVNPNAASLYEIVAADVHVSLSDADLASGFVAAATSTTEVTLDAGAVPTTNFYVGELIIFTHGTGRGQAREITGYTSGRVLTMSPALVTPVGTDTVWHVAAAVSIAEIADEVWDEPQVGHTVAGSFGEMATELAAIKVPTDKMVFTKANELDVNTKSLNDSAVTGEGTVGEPWDGP